MSVAPAPEEFVARWNKSVKDFPVDPVPIFEIVAESVVGVPAITEVGVILPAVRSGSVALTFTRTFTLVVPFGFVHVYV
jgi:hypothetical protein